MCSFNLHSTLYRFFETIGMFTMQWAKIFGSKKVVVFDISDERLELAKKLGADEVVNTMEDGSLASSCK